LCDLRLPPTILTPSVYFDRSEYRSFRKEEFEVGPLILAPERDQLEKHVIPVGLGEQLWKTCVVNRKEHTLPA
jgi:hypothetical protein